MKSPSLLFFLCATFIFYEENAGSLIKYQCNVFVKSELKMANRENNRQAYF